MMEFTKNSGMQRETNDIIEKGGKFLNKQEINKRKHKRSSNKFQAPVCLRGKNSEPNSQTLANLLMQQSLRIHEFISKTTFE